MPMPTRIKQLSTILDGYKTYILGLLVFVLVIISHTTGEDPTQWLGLVHDGALPAMLMALRHGYAKK